MGLEALCSKRGYPLELKNNCTFDPDFVVRGLSYDRRTGFLFKLDQFGKIQRDCVYSGRTRVSEAKVLETYHSHTKLSREYINGNLETLSDLFSLPEACLLADVTGFFQAKGANFHPSHVHRDVQECISDLHRSQALHREIMKDIPLYLEPSPKLRKLFLTFKNANKKLFLLSNSSFFFIQAGMNHIIGPDWQELFDIVIVQSQKPKWYSRQTEFRALDQKTGAMGLYPIDEFRPGEVYTHGSLECFHRLLKIPGDQVLYMGDQIYTDLLIPQRMAVWKTAAIIHEVQREVQISQTKEYADILTQLLDTEERLAEIQHGLNREIVMKLRDQKLVLSMMLKNLFNCHFGSVFRTYEERSLFFFNVCRLTDLYTSAAENFLNYPLDYLFQVRRMYYPHEPSEEQVRELSRTK
jgi:HAD superfamily 5'-nucleotidase-like hydrolase